MAAVPKSAQSGWKELAAIFEHIATLQNSPAEMIRAILGGGYESYLATQYTNFSARVEDLRRLADFALRYKEMRELLDELALSSGVAGQSQLAEGSEEECVTLSTVHQAKGLEWRAVFVIWVVDGKIPDARALRDDEREGEEEERRLFYVACTRARDQLYLTYPTIADERQLLSVIQRPSRFIEELDRSTYEDSVITS